jgi:hypothetical protein
MPRMSGSLKLWLGGIGIFSVHLQSPTDHVLQHREIFLEKPNTKGNAKDRTNPNNLNSTQSKAKLARLERAELCYSLAQIEEQV